jgi:hypothetical protein
MLCAAGVISGPFLPESACVSGLRAGIVSGLGQKGEDQNQTAPPDMGSAALYSDIF